MLEGGNGLARPGLENKSLGPIDILRLRGRLGANTVGGRDGGIGVRP